MTAAPRPPGPLSALGIGIVVAVVVVDQITKAIAEAKLDYQAAIEILPILALFRVHNTGIAFSFAHGFDSLLLVAGILLVFIPAIGMFAITQLMGGGIQPTIGEVIQNQFLQARDWPFGAALGMTIVVLFAITFWFTSRKQETA